jgi:hypothetical protein
MEDGAAMLRTDWLGGRWFEGSEIGIKLPCGRFPQRYYYEQFVLFPSSNQNVMSFPHSFHAHYIYLDFIMPVLL